VKNPDFPLRRGATRARIYGLRYDSARINKTKLKSGIRKTNGSEISRNRRKKERDGAQS